MAETVENPWWREGWRLLRERLPAIFTSRRRRLLLLVVIVSAIAAFAVGALLFARLGGSTWELATLVSVLIVPLAVMICLTVWSVRDREPDYRAGRVSLRLEEVFDLAKPVPVLSAELRTEARVHIDRARLALPSLIVGSAAPLLFFVIALIAIAITGWWSFNVFGIVLLTLINAWQPVYYLKILGMTTRQLHRIEEAGEPPTYLGPKGWGIEAPRNPPEGGGASG